MVAQIDKKMIKARPFKTLGRFLAWGLFEGRPLTTKGRWINFLVFAGYRLAQLLPISKKSESPIYIVGTGRSGTTILGKLFAIHKETIFLNEPKALWHFACGNEDIIGSYSTEGGNVRLNEHDATATVATKIQKIYTYILKLTLAKRVVDKYPECIFRVKFILKLIPNARFIAIVRDGVDTCSSVDDWSKRNSVRVEGETHDWWGRNDQKWKILVNEIVPEHDDLKKLKSLLLCTTDHKDRAALEWILAMREAKIASEEYKEVLTISYESLCENTEVVISDVLSHCNLEPDQKFSDYANSIFYSAPTYSPIEIMPELVKPFKQTLIEMGYHKSVDRVHARKPTK